MLYTPTRVLIDVSGTKSFNSNQLDTLYRRGEAGVSVTAAVGSLGWAIQVSLPSSRAPAACVTRSAAYSKLTSLVFMTK